MNEFKAALFFLNLKNLNIDFKRKLLAWLIGLRPNLSWPDNASTSNFGLSLILLKEFFLENGMTWSPKWDEEVKSLNDTFLSLQSLHDLNFSCVLDANFPKQLLDLTDPCLAFSFYGDASWTQVPFLSVVGSRDPLRESLDWLQIELDAFLSSHQWGIASGGAFGVDQAAHLSALRQQRPTVVFLPSGLGRCYPTQLLKMKDKILSTGGAIVSEYPFDMVMHKGMFPHRNRLIAAFGVATLIIQANQRSGTLMTARLSAENSRPVFVLPGHPMHSQFAGSLQLLQDGATMITSAADLSAMMLSEYHASKHAQLDIGSIPWP